MAKGSELAKVESFNVLAVVEGGPTPLQLMQENFGEEKLSVQDLTRVAMPGAGGTRWVIPTIEGESDADAIVGVVVHQMTSRAFWRESFDQTGGGTPPDCFSNDGIHGTGNIGDGTIGRDCANCPMAKFGSDGKRGQACKESRILFVLGEGDMLPISVWLSPMSIAPWRKFTMALAQKAKSLYDSVVALKLVRDKNKDGIAYAKIDPQYMGALAPDASARVRDYAAGFKQLLTMQASDVVGIHTQE